MKRNLKITISMILCITMLFTIALSAAAENESLLDKLNAQLKEAEKGTEPTSDSLIDTDEVSLEIYERNWVEGDKPSVDDIIATGDDIYIKIPQESYFLDEYEYKYVVNKDGGDTVFIFDDPTIDFAYNYHSPLAYHGSQVVVLAERQIHSCILYRTYDNELHAGWICTENLQDNFPGDKLAVGKKDTKTYGKNLTSFVPSIWWSEEYAADTRTYYTVIDNEGKDCISITFDYQVIGRNGVYKPHEGREVYCLVDGSWIKAGEFDVKETLDPIQFTIHFKKPVSVEAFFIIPTELHKQDIDVRQSVIEMCCPEE